MESLFHPRRGILLCYLIVGFSCPLLSFNRTARTRAVPVVHDCRILSAFLGRRIPVNGTTLDCSVEFPPPGRPNGVDLGQTQHAHK